MITVNNSTGKSIDVAINRWGTGGSTEFFTISSGSNGTWNREDGRGFVMVITKKNEDRRTGTYWFVRYNANIRVNSLNSVSGADNQFVNPYNS